MDDAKRDKTGSADAAEAKRRPQAPVLDLKATEIGEAKGQAAQAESPASAEPAASPQADPDAKDPAARAAEAPVPKAPRGGRVLAAAVLAGAAAGIVAALAGVWTLGLMDRREADAARIAAVENRLRELSARPSVTPEALQAVTNRVAGAEQAQQSLKSFEQRVTQLEASVRALPSAAPAGESDARIPKLAEATRALETELGSMRARLDEVAAAAGTARETASRASPSSNVAANTGEIEALGKRLQSLEAQAQALQQRAATPPPDRDRVARFAAATLALRTAVERGDPFIAELAAVRALTSDPARLRPLEDAAADGIVGSRELARDLSRLIVEVRQAQISQSGGEGGGSMFDRLQASASKLVRVRPVGEEAPAHAEDALAGLETKAARADIAGAVAEAEKLPPALRAPFEPWMQKAQSRVASIDAARALARESLAALSAPGTP